MDEGQYILPTELVAVVGFVLIPAIALTLASQAYILHRAGMWKSSPRRVLLGLLATVGLGVVGAFAVLAFAPPSFGALLRIREVQVMGQHWPVWPAGFALLGAAAAATTWWLKRGAGSAA